MSIPLFLPIPTYADLAPPAKALTIRALCARAGVACKATGQWVDRPVELVLKTNAAPNVVAAPGDWGVVRITHAETDKVKAAQFALAVMAYAMHDLVCRQSIAGQAWAQIALPRGRLRKPKAASNAQRQQQFRARQRAQRATRSG
jgi:hypothetical protein